MSYSGSVILTPQFAKLCHDTETFGYHNNQENGPIRESDMRKASSPNCLSERRREKSTLERSININRLLN